MREASDAGRGSAGQGGSAVDEGRLWRRLERLARVGAVPDEQGGGVVRPAYGAAHAEAAALVAGWMREAGLHVGRDSCGTLIGTLPGGDPGRGALALGSHLDTVPNGGAFDGALGVLAAIEAAEALARSGERLRHPLAVLAFADEEGNSCGIGVLSAQIWTGDVGPERLSAIRMEGGGTLADAVAAFDVPGVPLVPRPPLAAYLEAHVEQGPVLDAAGAPAAAVEAIVGISRTTVRMVGEPNHGGTTPMTMRKDALWGAAELALAVRELALAEGGRAVATVGVFEIAPGATNVVPGAARLRVELRAPEAERLARLRAAVEERARAAAARYGLAVELDPWHDSPPVAMHPLVLRATQQALVDRGLPERTMPSWAGHDAKVLARHVPVGMVFVPSVGGVSHSPLERTHPADCAHAAALLLHAARRLDRALGDGG